MLICDATGPIASKRVPQRFGLSDAIKWRTYYIFEKFIDAFKDFLVGRNPELVIIP
jgi:hypothetical protein